MSRIIVSPQSIVQNFLLFQRDTLQFLLHAMPLGEVVFFKTGNLKPSYVINSPAFIQEILVSKDASFQKGRASNVLRRTIGDGLLTSEAGEHKRQKAVMMPTFYKERVQRYGELMIEETRRAVDRWSEGQTVMLNEEMMKLTLSIITRTMFGEEISEERKAEVADAVGVTIARSAKLLYSPVMMPFFVPTVGNYKHKQALRTLDQLVDEILQSYERDDTPYKDTMIDLLAAVRDADGNALPRSEIRDQMVTMLIAGHETTANAMNWVWFVLSQETEHLQRIREEADQVDWDTSSAFDIYRQLKYTQLCIQETLRLYPPAWLILREAKENVEILGETFVKGSSLLISPYALHRNPAVFEDPLAFRPERFAGDKTFPRFTYFPFGGGSRSCIGSTFALMEATFILAVMARHLKLERKDPAAQVKPETSVSLRMTEDLAMIVRKW